MARAPRILDSSLQDGAEAAGPAFALQDRVQIATGLDALGVHEIALGRPARDAGERECVRALSQLGLRARLRMSAGFDAREIAQCAGLGAKRIDIALPPAGPLLSEPAARKRLLGRLVELLRQAGDLGLETCVGLEDMAGIEPDFILQLADVAARAGALRLRCADRGSRLEPFAMHRLVRKLTQESALKIEIQAGNRLGLATANTLAAVRAGATWLHTSLYGRQAASLDEVLPALQELGGHAISIQSAALACLRSQLARAAASRATTIRLSPGQLPDTARRPGDERSPRSVAIEFRRQETPGRAQPFRRPRPPCC